MIKTAKQAIYNGTIFISDTISNTIFIYFYHKNVANVIKKGFGHDKEWSLEL